MLTKASIKNFKSLRDVGIDLERFTVFVGPNASGKSSVLQSLDLLCRTFRIDHPMQLDAEYQSCASRGATGPVELAVEVEVKWYRFSTRPTRASSTPASPFGTPSRTDGRSVGDATGMQWKNWQPCVPGAAPLPQSALLRLEGSKLINPAHATQDPTVMASDGAGLHTALAGMALHDPDSWRELQANLNRIIPTIRRLRHTKSTHFQQPAALLFDTVGADSLSADQVSEGTLLVLGLLTALHSAGRPNLVLLDDLDRGLHPKAQRELITLLRGLLGTNPDLQILATTHSPYMLDCMESNEVRMTLLRDDGSTACAALAAHPKFEQWKDEMTPGEMWSLFGEKWLVEGAKA